MKTKLTHQKIPRLSNKKKENQDLSTKPSILNDEEQIATQNLFNISNYEDNINYQKKFNTTFDIFSSVDFHEQYLDGNNLNSNLLKTARTNHNQMYHRKSLQKKKRFQKTSTSENKYVKTYNTIPQPSSTKSSFIRYKVKKQQEKSSYKRKVPIIFNQLHSNTVFVGKNIKASSKQSLFTQKSLNQFWLNLESPNIYANCHRFRLKSNRLDNDQKYPLFEPKKSLINDQAKACIGNITPKQMSTILYESFLKNQGVQKMRKSTLELTDFRENLFRSSCVMQKTQKRKTSENKQILSNTKISRLDQITDRPLSKRKLSSTKQRR